MSSSSDIFSNYLRSTAIASSSTEMSRDVHHVVKEDRHLSKRHVEGVGIRLPPLHKCRYESSVQLALKGDIYGVRKARCLYSTQA
ncbi:unnamed protein product [Linum trigynum]|uniref:Uncharacterized protein n=1 Tax=Linum trigynum TaxID=586398 RepID=A0AAV2FVR6_9ROSI